MLVVVEDRDLHLPLQSLLDLEAFRCGDVLEIDAAERRLQQLHRLNKRLGIARIDFEIEDIDVGESLEEDCFPFHHGLSGRRPDVAQA